MEENDSHCLNPFFCNLPADNSHFLFVKSFKDFAFEVHPFLNRESQTALNQWFRSFKERIV